MPPAIQPLSRDILSNKSLEHVLPLIVTMVEKAGHCMPRDKVERVYGKDAVTLACYRGVVKPITVISRDREKRVPDQAIKALSTKEWDESQPLWLS